MGSTSFSISTTNERLNEIERINPYNCKSDFINKAIDVHIKTLKTRYLSDVLYYIGIPLLALIGLFGLSLYFKEMFFVLLTAIVGIYLVVLVVLFYDKYRGGKHA